MVGLGAADKRMPLGLVQNHLQALDEVKIIAASFSLISIWMGCILKDPV